MKTHHAENRPPAVPGSGSRAFKHAYRGYRQGKSIGHTPEIGMRAKSTVSTRRSRSRAAI